MSIQRFIPQIWSAKLLVALRAALVYGGPQIINRDYEGDVAQAGSTVRITSISRPTIGDYVPNSTSISPEQVQDAQRTLVIDQSKYFAFGVDDVDARQARGNVLTQAMSEAAYALADTVDQFIAGLYTGVASANNLGTVDLTSISPSTGVTFYDKVLLPLGTALSRASVPTNGRYVVVSPESLESLLHDDRFIKVNESGTADGLRNGQIGRAAGFDVLVSNNTPGTVDAPVIIAGTSGAITFADQINKVEAYRPQDAFEDAVKGLALYGAKLIRPSGIAVATATLKS